MRITKQYIVDNLEKSIKEYEVISGKPYKHHGKPQIPHNNLQAAIIYGHIRVLEQLLLKFK